MIYIVEDDANIRQMESYALQNSGYDVLEFGDSQSFWEQCSKLLPDLIVLDIMLPEEDGLHILKQLRNNDRTQKIPVIMVTAKTTELDTVRGLDNGADDYIPKPFGIMEFIARVKAILRRTTQEDRGAAYHYEDIILDEEKRYVTVSDMPCELTYKEFELLKCLLKNQSIVLSRDKIMDRVWGTDYEGETRTVDMHIKTLRQKLGKSGQHIKTIRNVGYKLE